MKKHFFDLLYAYMRNDKDIYIIFCGLGWPRIQELMRDFPDRAYNVEASEQTGLDVAVGLAYAGKKPFVYTITPFLLRGYETIRTYIDYEKLNVTLVGVGHNDEYSKHDGFSHDASDISRHMSTFENIDQYYPEDENELKDAIEKVIIQKGPKFINIKK